jgi:hypothetical protein
MHNWMDRVAQPFALPQNSSVTSTYLKDVPIWALQHENLLNAILALSATNLLRDDPNSAQLRAARDRYVILAYNAQRRAVECLNDGTVDVTCIASLMILVNSFAMLHDRNIEPYSPPTAWLKMGRGSRSVIDFLRNAVNQESHAKVKKVLEHPSVWTDSFLYDEQHRRNFLGVLSQHFPSNEDMNDETRKVYEKTLSYVGSIQTSLQNGEPPFALCRRIICFPMFIPPAFIDFVQEERPRALVVLAHFFAVVAMVRAAGAVWWIGNAGEREIAAIQSVLPSEWQAQMVWPLAMADPGPK